MRQGKLHAEGKGDPLADALGTTGPDTSDPLAYLARGGDRIDVTRQTTDDGRTVVMHRSPRSGEWVLTDETGKVKTTSWQQEKKQRSSDAKIDGSQHGSKYDSETGKFVRSRIK